MFTPVVQFLLGCLYYKLRDTLWGVFGSRQSLARGLAIDVLMAIVVMLSALAFVALNELNIEHALGYWPGYFAAAIIAAVIFWLLARYRGPTEIRDTLWASLPLDEPLEAA